MARPIATIAAVVAMLAATAPAATAEPQGFFEEDAPVGYFYGTFFEDPNIVLLLGGTAEEFCLDNPEDPFNGAPGTAPLRTFLRADGSVDLRSNVKDLPINLYYDDSGEIGDGPRWISQVCDDYFGGGSAPEPFATGTADLKERISVVSEDLVDVFNSINGTATGTDGTQYKLRASADLVVENGAPVGDPSDFVSFELHEISRG